MCGRKAGCRDNRGTDLFPPGISHTSTNTNTISHHHPAEVRWRPAVWGKKEEQSSATCMQQGPCKKTLCELLLEDVLLGPGDREHAARKTMGECLSHPRCVRDLHSMHPIPQHETRMTGLPC